MLAFLCRTPMIKLHDSKVCKLTTRPSLFSVTLLLYYHNFFLIQFWIGYAKTSFSVVSVSRYYYLKLFYKHFSPGLNIFSFFFVIFKFAVKHFKSDAEFPSKSKNSTKILFFFYLPRVLMFYLLSKISIHLYIPLVCLYRNFLIP